MHRCSNETTYVVRDVQAQCSNKTRPQEICMVLGQKKIPGHIVIVKENKAWYNDSFVHNMSNSVTAATRIFHMDFHRNQMETAPPSVLHVRHGWFLVRGKRRLNSLSATCASSSASTHINTLEFQLPSKCFKSTFVFQKKPKEQLSVCMAAAQTRQLKWPSVHWKLNHWLAFQSFSDILS